MSDNTTKRMISAYFQDALPTAHLTGMFQARPENFHSSEEVEIDVIRSEEDVSVAVTDLSTGYRMNADDLGTNKGFKPPIHKEAIALNSSDLIKRMPGENPFESPNFRGNVITRMFRGMTKVEQKIRRAVELQASQVLQTGVISLTDSNGVAVYDLDFQPKATHFPTTGATWAAGAGDQLGDLESLSEVIRGDGLSSPDQLHFGLNAFKNFMLNTAVKERLNHRYAPTMQISKISSVGQGGIYRGTVDIGNYTFDMFTYDGRYKHPQTGVSTPYIDPDKVIMRSSTARFDATFGAIPNIGAELGATTRLIPELPQRMSSGAATMDLFTNVWLSADGEQLFGGVGSRPLLIPTAIDTYGCLTTVV